MRRGRIGASIVALLAAASFDVVPVAIQPALAQEVGSSADAQSGYADWVAFMEGSNELRHQKLLDYEMGPYPENRDAYRHISSIHAVPDVETSILVVHGEGRYPGSPHSRLFATALQEHHKPYRYKAYPSETYYVYGKENRRQLQLDMEAFLDVYLQDEPPTLPGVRHLSEDGR